MAGFIGGHFGHHHGHHRHHHHQGPGLLTVAAEAAAVGAVAGAVVAAAASSRPSRPGRQALPAQQVVVVDSRQTSVVSQPAYVAQPPAYLSGGYIVRGDTAFAKGKGKGKGKGKAKQAQQAAPVTQRLGIAQVVLPAEAIELRETVNFFAVDVTPEGIAEPWRVMRRYNDFLNLQASLGSGAHFPGACFPKKHLFGCKGEKLEARRCALQLWIQRALEHPASNGAWRLPLQQFLESGRQMLSATVAAAPNTAAPEETSLLEMQIPPGIIAGQLLGVTVPDGRQLNVLVPEGSQGGDNLLLLYNATAGTLSLA